MRALLRALREQDAVVGDDPDRHAVEAREAGDEGGAVARLELVEARAVDDPGDDLAHVVGLPRVPRDHAVDLLRVVERLLAGLERHRLGLDAIEAGDDAPGDRQRMAIVVGEVVGDARKPGVHVAAAELLGADDLADRRLHQRRPAEEDRALVLDDHGLVAHRRHVGAARRARAHHHRDLGDALGAHVGLVEEDPAEVLAVGKDLVLARQEGAAGIDQVDAGQAVLQRDLLRPQMLLDRHRVVGAALHRRIVGDDHAFLPRDPADAGDHPGGRGLAVVHAEGGELADLEEGRAGVEQAVDALARQQLAARRVALPRLGVAAEGDLGGLGPQVVDLLLQRGGVAAEIVRARVDARGDRGHGSPAVVVALGRSLTAAPRVGLGRQGRGRILRRAVGACPTAPGPPAGLR